MGRIGQPGNVRYRKATRVEWHLYPLLPLLLPWICDEPKVLLGERFVVRQLHGGDQIFAEERLGHRGVRPPRLSLIVVIVLRHVPVIVAAATVAVQLVVHPLIVML